jgi:superfamily II DNA or RNA helicase
MLKDCQWSSNRMYQTGTENEPLQFYLEGLANSKEFQLLLGYFSSAAINLMPLAFATFISKGGKMKMVINHLLSAKDKEIISNVENNANDIKYFDLTDVDSLRRALNEYDTHFFECLAYLIKEKRIEIKVIKPKNGKGIAHYKSGVFSDGQDSVGYQASCNFTYYGLSENIEQLTAFLSWEGSNIYIENQLNIIDDYFNERDQDVDYVPTNDIEVAIKDTFGNKNIEELLVNEAELLKKKMSLANNAKIKESMDKLYQNIEIQKHSPRFPYPKGPREYQKVAYDNWVTNNYKGIFAMATGTGKTITSLNCVLQEYNKNKIYRFIVLVPTISLANQWETEIIQKFNFEELTVCSSKNIWEEEIKRYIRNLNLSNDSNFAIITTYATFRSIKFQNLLQKIIKLDVDNLIIIADEAHTFGSKNLLNLLPHQINKRIGLSATPERQYDELGFYELCNYFNSYEPNYTFSFNMKKAIESEVLCRYFYYPHIVELEHDELNIYRKKTDELSKWIDPKTEKYKDNPAVTKLLIERKNVLHKARRKINCLDNIVNSIGVNNFNFAFIYVPEGFEANYENDDSNKFNGIDEYDNTNKTEENLIDKYKNLLHEKYKLKVRKFTGDTNDRVAVLKQFENGQLNALLAMKCLDEGVDIPQAKYAVFCSSTGNPRQYIQRRGRVLRTHSNKKFAYIYDMTIKPIISSTNEKQTKLERNIFLGEMRRLVNFAVLAENKFDCLKKMESICNDLEIDIYELANIEENKYLDNN